jgi:hypothetical protein
MNLRIGIAAGLLALGACGGGDKAGDGNQAGGEKAAGTESGKAEASAGSGVRLRAGEWEMKTEVAAVSAPGMPAGVADMMKAKASTVKVCVTEEDASKGDAGIFTGKKDPRCDTKGFSAAGGRVNGTITCKAEEGGQGAMTMTMDGQFKPDSYTLTSKMKTEGEGAEMTIESRVSGRRIGDCPAGKEA